jgi:hypothetical protein
MPIYNRPTLRRLHAIAYVRSGFSTRCTLTMITLTGKHTQTCYQCTHRDIRRKLVIRLEGIGDEADDKDA